MVSLLNSLVDFFLRVWSGLIDFFAEIIPLILKTIVVFSPFLFGVLGGYVFWGGTGLVTAVAVSIIFIFLGVVWSAKKSTQDSSLSFKENIVPILLINIVVCGTIYFAMTKINNDLVHDRFNGLVSLVMMDFKHKYMISDSGKSGNISDRYLPSELILHKLWFNKSYTEEQRELFFNDMKGQRTKFKEIVNDIDVKNNLVRLSGQYFLSVGGVYKPELRLRNKSMFKQIQEKSQYDFDCEISGYYSEYNGKRYSVTTLLFKDCTVQ